MRPQSVRVCSRRERGRDTSLGARQRSAGVEMERNSGVVGSIADIATLFVEHRGDTTMESRTPRWIDHRLDSDTHQRVHKAVFVEILGRFNEPGMDRFIERIERTVLLQIGDEAGDVQREPLVEQRSDP